MNEAASVVLEKLTKRGQQRGFFAIDLAQPSTHLPAPLANLGQHLGRDILEFDKTEFIVFVALAHDQGLGLYMFHLAQRVGDLDETLERKVPAFDSLES